MQNTIEVELLYILYLIYIVCIYFNMIVKFLKYILNKEFKKNIVSIAHTYAYIKENNRIN